MIYCGVEWFLILNDVRSQRKTLLRDKLVGHTCTHPQLFRLRPQNDLLILKLWISLLKFIIIYDVASGWYESATDTIRVTLVIV